MITIRFVDGNVIRIKPGKYIEDRVGYTDTIHLRKDGKFHRESWTNKNEWCWAKDFPGLPNCFKRSIRLDFEFYKTICK